MVKKAAFKYVSIVISVVLFIIALCACGAVDTPVTSTSVQADSSEGEIPAQPDTEISSDENSTTGINTPAATEKPSGASNTPPEILAGIAEALPDGWSYGEFDIMLGYHGGGIPIYNDAGEPGGFIELNYAAEPIFSDGALTGVASIDNHASFVSEFIMVDSSLPCVYAEYSRDIYDYEQNRYNGTEESWYVFWAKEGHTPVYAAYILKSAMSQEDVTEFAEGVQFNGW